MAGFTSLLTKTSRYIPRLARSQDTSQSTPDPIFRIPPQPEVLASQDQASDLCLECRAINWQEVDTLAADLEGLQAKMNENRCGILLAYFKRKYRSSPKNGCSLCQFFYQSVQHCMEHLDSIDPVEEYDLRMYLFRRVSPVFNFALLAKHGLNFYTPCLAVVPTHCPRARSEFKDCRLSTRGTVPHNDPPSGYIFWVRENESKNSKRLVPQILPREANLARAKNWLGYCRKYHRSCADRGEQIEGLKLIDCESEAIVWAPTHAYYAALSYVWGSSTQSDPGLTPPSLPPYAKTVKDAIAATKLLGMRYLWVDRHCIDQTNEAEKQYQISKMDLVYQRAEITIVAAAGNGASYGLPGINGTPRESQPTLVLPDRILFETMMHPSDTIPKSTWSSRGWTLQESVLSRRKLVFTETQMYFECDGMDCSESTTVDLKHIHAQSNSLDLCPPIRNRSGDLYRYEDGHSDGVERCRALLQNYSERTLSHDSDIRNAFLGTTRYLGVHEMWGIPFRVRTSPNHNAVIADIMLGLCWMQEYSTRRRTSLVVNGENLPVPSWSWMGWPGDIDFSHLISGYKAILPASLLVELPSGVMVEPASDHWEESAKSISVAKALHIKARIFDTGNFQGFNNSWWYCPSYLCDRGSSLLACDHAHLSSVAASLKWRFLLISQAESRCSWVEMVFLVLEQCADSSYSRVGIMSLGQSGIIDWAKMYPDQKLVRIV